MRWGVERKVLLITLDERLIDARNAKWGSPTAVSRGGRYLLIIASVHLLDYQRDLSALLFILQKHVIPSGTLKYVT